MIFLLMKRAGNMLYSIWTRMLQAVVTLFLGIFLMVLAIAFSYLWSNRKLIRYILDEELEEKVKKKKDGERQ